MRQCCHRVVNVVNVGRSPESSRACPSHFQEADAAFVAKALGDSARAKSMMQIAHDTGLLRESLYKALSGKRNPSFETVLRVIKALGLKLHAGVSTS
jgi:probable addiction module antidote protein